MLKKRASGWRSWSSAGFVTLAGTTCLMLLGCPGVPGGNGGGGGGGNGGNGGGGDTTTPPGQAFTDASAARGGQLYDEFWEVTNAAAAKPTTDHPLWSSRPDQTTNTRTGSDTWRCKECHGWDYKGQNGAYSPSSSHHTGFDGIFGTTLAAQAAFDLIKTDHGYGDAGLSDADIWDLAKFVLEGQIDTDTVIDDSGAFTGDEAAGQTIFDSGLNTTLACAACHGSDGVLIPPGADEDFGDFLGFLSNENPWEFLHKVRFGMPGVAGMPGLVAGGGSDQDASDLAAYSQTLPEAP